MLKICYFCELITNESKEDTIVINTDDGEFFRLHSLCLCVLIKEFIDEKKARLSEKVKE